MSAEAAAGSGQHRPRHAVTAQCRFAADAVSAVSVHLADDGLPAAPGPPSHVVVLQRRPT